MWECGGVRVAAEAAETTRLKGKWPNAKDQGGPGVAAKLQRPPEVKGRENGQVP